MWKLKTNVNVFHIRDENGDIVAEVRKTFSFNGTKNARLIAAAPDLLYACKIAFYLMDSEPTPTPETESVIEKLSFAIGKAEQ